MQRLMLALDRLLRRRRWWVLGAWLAVLVAALPLAARQSDELTGGGFSAPGSQSLAVAEALDRDFPQTARGRIAVLLAAESGSTVPDRRAAVARLARAVAESDDVTLAPADRRAALAAASRRDRLILIPLDVAVDEDHSADVAVDLRDRLAIADGPQRGVSTHLLGPGGMWSALQDVSKEDLRDAEAIGFPIVLLILVAVFGSFAAATLPLALAIAAVLVTGAEIHLLSRTMEMSVFVTNMASMIGIGVAVDYSLFILARYREELAAGRTREQARATAMATSGVAVAFSGATVIVSLAGLWLIPSTALRSMALGALLVVAVSVVAAATLLPVLISIFGRRAYARNRLFTVSALVARSWRPRRRGSTRVGSPRGFWLRWTAMVTRRPAVSALASAGVLLVLAVPALSLETRPAPLSQLPDGHETRVGFERASQLAPRGASTPVHVVVRFRRGDARSPANAAALRALRAQAARDPGVARTLAPAVGRDRRSALLTALPRHDGESPSSRALIDRLRERLPAVAPGAEIDVGGNPARQVDMQRLVAGSMWKIVLFVLGLSYVVLVPLLRSVVLPLKAVLVNLLSVGAAYGVMVAVFQWGWFDGLLGFQSRGHLDIFTPPLVLAVVFGLSMDYEVFLLTRVRERWEATGDSRRAVAEGLAASARTITSAALIMVAVFAVFVSTGVPSIKELGLGNAVAIAVDATIVRLILVPATMELLGDWNWWLPRPLERLLPRSSFERPPEAAEPEPAT